MNETGLPELPEGYFWRVEETRLLGNFLGYTVSIRKRGRFFSSHVWGYTWREIKPNETHEEVIRSMAEDRLEEWKAHLITEKKIPTLVGDYPPKKLGA